jgi:ferredoxin
MHRLRRVRAECPADAIKPDTEPGLEKRLEVNTEYAKSWPNNPRRNPLDAMRGGRKLEKYFSESGRRRLICCRPFARFPRPA